MVRMTVRAEYPIQLAHILGLDWRRHHPDMREFLPLVFLGQRIGEVGINDYVETSVVQKESCLAQPIQYQTPILCHI